MYGNVYEKPNTLLDFFHILLDELAKVYRLWQFFFFRDIFQIGRDAWGDKKGETKVALTLHIVQEVGDGRL